MNGQKERVKDKEARGRTNGEEEREKAEPDKGGKKKRGGRVSSASVSLEFGEQPKNGLIQINVS